MNRLKDQFDEPPEKTERGDFYWLETRFDSFAVLPFTAYQICCWLDQRTSPRWITFRDLHGALHRILAVHVYRISESTPVQRAASRSFWRARRLETRADRSWDDDDKDC